MTQRARTPGEISIWIVGKSRDEVTKVLKEWSSEVAEVARREGWREGYRSGANDYEDGWE